MALVSAQGFKRYLANTSWMMGERVIRMAVALVVGVYVARYLGPGRFGLLSYAVSFVGLFSALATLGLDGIVVRGLVEDPGERERIMGSAFILKLVGAVVLIALVLAGLQVTSNDRYTKTMVLIVAGGFLFQSFNVIDFFFQSQVMARFAATAQLCALLLSSAVKVLLVVLQAPLLWFAGVVAFENVLLALCLVFNYHKRGFAPSRWRFEGGRAIELLQDSWPLMLSGMVIMVYMRIDQVMIKEMLDGQAVGNYAAAVQLSEAWYFFPTVISASLFPAIVDARGRGGNLYYRRLQRLYDFMVWSAVVIALPVTLFAGDIIGLVFGTAYQQASGVLRVHIWGGVFVFLGVASGKWFLAENLIKLSFYRAVCGAIMNVILNLMFIPRYGILGAALSTLLAQFTAAYAYDALSKKTLICFRMKSRSFFPVHLIKGDYHVGPYS